MSDAAILPSERISPAGEMEKPTERLSVRAILEGWRRPMVRKVAGGRSRPSARCRVCGAEYRPSLAGDGRCGLCRARGRYWTPERIGTRAQVSVRCRRSAFNGLAGIGTRVDKPEDGWQVRLLESPERSLYFGVSNIEVDWEIREAREPMRGVFELPRGEK